MTSLLVVRELYPESTRLNAVPVNYVGQVIFQHEQGSDLRIFENSKDIGFLRLQPRTVDATGQRLLEMNGTLNVMLVPGHPRRISWVANFTMSADLTPEKLGVDLSTSEPGQHTEITLDFLQRRAAIRAKLGAEILSEMDLSMDRAGFEKLMQQAGANPALLDQLNASRSQIPAFEFAAQSSSMVIQKQRLDTFLVTMKADEISLLEIQVSQLGQILSAQVMPPRWRLTPFNLPQ